MKKTKEISIILLSVLVLFLLSRGCKEPEPKIKTKDKVRIIKDTITVVEISKPKIVYVERVKTIKGKDSIVYKEKPTEATSIAKQYNSMLKSNKATADLKITTTGELLDVSGVIEYPETTITTTVKEKVPQSGLFLFGQSDPTFETFGGGADIVIKNKIIIGAGLLKVNEINNPYVTLKVGLKLF